MCTERDDNVRAHKRQARTYLVTFPAAHAPSDRVTHTRTHAHTGPKSANQCVVLIGGCTFDEFSFLSFLGESNHTYLLLGLYQLSLQYEHAGLRTSPAVACTQETAVQNLAPKLCWPRGTPGYRHLIHSIHHLCSRSVFHLLPTPPSPPFAASSSPPES